MSAFSSSAFSTNAFSVNAFDFGGTPPTPSPVPAPQLGGGWAGYALPYDRREHERLAEVAEERRLDLQRIDDELAEAEQRKLAAQKRAKAKLLAEKAAVRLAKLERKLQEEINALRIERVRLMRMIDDDEAVLVLLMSQPFH